MAFSRMRINIGHNVNLTVPRLIGVINEVVRNRNIVIGKVEIMRTFSIFEADITHKNEILKAFRNAIMDGEELVVEPAGEGRPSNDRFGKKDDGGFKRKKRRDNRRWE
jgi:ATP-dependent RNA helicase DeaD